MINSEEWDSTFQRCTDEEHGKEPELNQRRWRGREF
jgi:hypothetical protein